MNFRLLVSTIITIFIFTSCFNSLVDIEELEEGVFKVEVSEVQEGTQYTYFKGTVGGEKQWFAVGKTKVKEGETYYYKEPLPMANFKSKELDKTFDLIYFLNKVQDNPDFSVKTGDKNFSHGKNAVEKKEVKIEKLEGTLSVSDIYENKETYNGKKVKVSGKVVKVNPEIMNRNWIHLQDGTEFDGKFDLTLTGSFVPEVGDVITVEGVLAVDKDFGAGYKYEVIIENSELK